MATKTFISHSSKDKPIVKELAEKLQKENIWFDAWDMDLGDVLSEKIEKGIDDSKNFLIILSENSINSKWVQYELNMALIKYLEEEDYKILVAKIDNVEVPLRLKPFLRVDCPNSSKAAEQIYNILFSQTSVRSHRVFKRQFVNRFDETNSLQDMFYSPDTEYISIIGFYGIGKTSFIQEAIKRIYSNSLISFIDLSPAHFGARLTIELCSKAGIEIPKDGASDADLRTANLLAIETILSSETFVVFNKFETILDDSGEPNDDIKDILTYFEDKEILKKTPFIILSTRWTKLDFIDTKVREFLKIGGLSEKHLSHILKSEIERSSPNLHIEDSDLHSISSLLHGYPLAARLAAPLIIKYNGIDYLKNNLHIINQIKIDIAEDIVANVKLTPIEIDILEVLSIFDNPLDPFYLSEVLSIDAETLNRCIDNLVGYNLLESNAEGLILHPLINNFYLKLARSSSNFKPFAEKLSDIAKKNFLSLKSIDKKYVYWLTISCRLLYYCGKLSEGKQLRQDLIGEIKNAAIKLYQKRDYETSLQFCNDFLETKPLDREILFTKARCLSRLGSLEDSKQILEDLIKNEKNKYQLAKYYYALGRSYIENTQKNEDYSLKKAEECFLQSIRINEHQSALQSMGEVLFRRKQLPEAASFIERKLQESPTDPFALSVYSDILWSMDRKADAIEKIIEALKHQPKNPNFLFRAGRFLRETNNLAGAYGFFKDAINFDDDFIDARLSLTDICIDLDYLEEAEEHISVLSRNVKGEKLIILDSIKANLLLKKGEISEAERIIKTLLVKNKNVVTLGLYAKIYIAKFKQNQQKGLNLLAKTDKEKAQDLINEGLEIEPDNEILKAMLESLN